MTYMDDEMEGFSLEDEEEVAEEPEEEETF
jgi:hypothetical protein